MPYLQKPLSQENFEVIENYHHRNHIIPHNHNHNHNHNQSILDNPTNIILLVLLFILILFIIIYLLKK